MQIYYDKYRNLNALRQKHIAVIGLAARIYSNQTTRESGCNVTVGLRADSLAARLSRLVCGSCQWERGSRRSRHRDDACARRTGADVYTHEIAESMTPGKTPHSPTVSIHFGFIKPPQIYQRFMVAPKGPASGTP
jgi:ketol-acid reductoisomerase